MARAIWSGEIAFGLVTIPTKLYTATRDMTPQFNQLHKECGTRIQMVRRCSTCNRDVEYSEIGKGYEVEKGKYALFTKEELAKIEGEDGAGGIDIVEFIDPKEVDIAFISKSYWVGPGGKSARGFELLRETLEKTNRVALAKVKIRTRTQLALLRPRDNLFALDMIHFADEMVSGDDIVVPDARAATDRELQLALNLVEQLSGPFDPSKHPDEYRAAVEDAAEEKTAAGEVATSAEEERPAAAGGKVIDLAELLATSLRVAKTGPKKASLPEPPPANEPEEEAVQEAVGQQHKPDGKRGKSPAKPAKKKAASG